jgi:CO/xanthine dehydrogenase Mo-binding subunit
MVDAPPVPTVVLELPHPDAPYGLRGVGEPPSVTSTPAVLAAVRAATGLALQRAPVRPQDIADTGERGRK